MGHQVVDTYRTLNLTTYLMIDANTYQMVDSHLPDKWLSNNPNVKFIGGSDARKSLKRSARTKRIGGSPR